MNTDGFSKGVTKSNFPNVSADPTPSRFRALLASLRIPNAPSVISNVWFGYMLGWFYWGGSTSPVEELTKLLTAGLCLYFAGNLANDWFDRRWDAKHRPERAIPAGLFKPISYLVATLCLAICGLSIAATLGNPSFSAAIAIVILIATYTWLHKRTRWAVIPMGLCRAGLYALGFFAIWPGPPDLHESDYGFYPVSPPDLYFQDVLRSFVFLATHASGILIYIAGLSLAARYESTEDPPHGMVLLSRAMLFLPLAAMSAWWMIWYPLPSLIGLVPFGIWLTLALTHYRRPIPVFVSALLAGIPLTDLIASVPLAISLVAPDQNILKQPLLLATILIPLSAFALGRLLQRVAPAT